MLGSLVLSKFFHTGVLRHFQNPWALQCKTVFNRYLSNNRSIKNFLQKTKCIYFRILVLDGPPHPVNWSPSHSTGPQTLFLTDISVTVAEIQKFQKTKCIYFQILVLGGPSPSQLVPKPFNWFPTHSTGPQTMFLLQVSQ